MVGLSRTLYEIYGVDVRPLSLIISGMAEPIEFKFRWSLHYVDLYKLPWSEGYNSETVRERHAQKPGVLITFLKNVKYKLDETLPDESYTCEGHLSEV
jgi:hypothetical protein